MLEPSQTNDHLALTYETVLDLTEGSDAQTTALVRKIVDATFERWKLWKIEEIFANKRAHNEVHSQFSQETRHITDLNHVVATLLAKSFMEDTWSSRLGRAIASATYSWTTSSA